MRNPFDLSGRVVWVVGGAGYLGAPCCEALAMHGAHVVIGDRRADAAGATAEALKRQGYEVSTLAIDMGDEASILDGAHEVCSRFGRLDAAVNLSTYSTGRPMGRMSLAEWEAGFRITLTGAFIWSRAVGEAMIRRGGGGSIVQFGSMYGKVAPDPGIYDPPESVNPVDYGVAKAGLLQLVRYQAVAWGKKNVRVNAIVPGPFPNPASAANDDGFLRRLAGKVPMGRVGKAEEIAGAVVFLSSDASSYVTGSQIVVDGGWTAW